MYLAPELSAQFMTAATGKPSVILSLDPTAPDLPLVAISSDTLFGKKGESHVVGSSCPDSRSCVGNVHQVVSFDPPPPFFQPKYISEMVNLNYIIENIIN